MKYTNHIWHIYIYIFISILRGRKRCHAYTAQSKLSAVDEQIKQYARTSTPTHNIELVCPKYRGYGAIFLRCAVVELAFIF